VVSEVEVWSVGLVAEVSTVLGTTAGASTGAGSTGGTGSVEELEDGQPVSAKVKIIKPIRLRICYSFYKIKKTHFNRCVSGFKQR
jgi:hypothetical protein